MYQNYKACSVVYFFNLNRLLLLMYKHIWKHIPLRLKKIFKKGYDKLVLGM